MRNKIIIIFSFCLLSLYACGGSPSPKAGSAESQPAANAAAARPEWVDSVDAVYSKSKYAAAVGHASSRDMAEKSAFANLTAFFGQSIQAEQTSTRLYKEAAGSGITASWTDDKSMQSTITTTAGMDNLLGAEIKEVWHDARNRTYYAVAVMEKEIAIRLYSDLVIANQDIITNLITMGQPLKFSLDGFSRYQLAAVISDINITYENIIKLLGAEPPLTVLSGDAFRIEAQNITKAIPIGIKVTNDKADRIQNAFAKALSDRGFRSGSANSRYILDVKITLEPVSYPNNRRKFARMELSANLTDTRNGAVLIPYNFNAREGHSTIEEAENLCFITAEKWINGGDNSVNPPLPSYSELLKNYLSQLLPKK
jgi:hypothetical protein